MKSLIISEKDKIAAIMENEKAIEFFINRGDLLLGDIYTAKVENIMPSIEAVFVNLGNNRMGFLHASDIPGQGNLYDRVQPNQKLMVQIVKEPTSNKGPRVNTAISLPGRFLVLTTENTNVSVSRKIVDYQERNRLKAMVTLLKPPGVGIVVRTEAEGKDEYDLEEDFKTLWDLWKEIADKHENHKYSGLVHRDQDFIYRVIRDAYTAEIDEVVLDTTQGQIRTQQILKNWTGKDLEITVHKEGNILSARGVEREILNALQTKVELPSGGYLFIQTTEAMTVVDVNSGRFTSSRTLRETVLKTNLEAAHEVARQLKLRNIGGVIVVDFIDMDDRKDQISVLEAFENALMTDRAKPQIGQLSDLGLVELTRRRQGQSLLETFGHQCNSCSGTGLAYEINLNGEIRRQRQDGQGQDDRQHDRNDWRNQRNRRGGMQNRRYDQRGGRSRQDSYRSQGSPVDDSEAKPPRDEAAEPQVEEELVDSVESTVEGDTDQAESQNEFDNEFDQDAENEYEDDAGEDSETEQDSYSQDAKFNVKPDDVSGVFTLTPKEDRE
ncbi:MAG: Rne/Rng family ribonuclease [Candidatus Melainabacteria bacterium]|nr:Rne/Rng family ribonuclease [Candidatus Melainabacteria bacterium]